MANLNFNQDEQLMVDIFILFDYETAVMILHIALRRDYSIKDKKCMYTTDLNKILSLQFKKSEDNV